MTPSDLKQAREGLGYSQVKMAELIGVSRRQYQYLESGNWEIELIYQNAIRWVLYNETGEINETV